MRSLEIKRQIIQERKKGKSFKKLASDFGIPEGTVYYWIKDVKISNKAKNILQKNSELGRRQGRETTLRKKIEEQKLLKVRIKKEISLIPCNVATNKLLCSFLFWAEGAKALNSLNFINSDPQMVRIFLSLLRSSFNIDEHKFRVLVHLHEYHNETEILQFWSNLTRIPLLRFNKSFYKPHSGENKKEGYKGCVSIKYYDAKIARELFYVYNIFSVNLGA